MDRADPFVSLISFKDTLLARWPRRPLLTLTAIYDVYAAALSDGIPHTPTTSGSPILLSAPNLSCISQTIHYDRYRIWSGGHNFVGIVEQPGHSACGLRRAIANLPTSTIPILPAKVLRSLHDVLDTTSGRLVPHYSVNVLVDSNRKKHHGGICTHYVF